MDWEQYGNDRNLLLRLIELEMKQFNKRIDRVKYKLDSNINVNRWIEEEFILFIDELGYILQEVTLFQVGKKIEKEEDFDSFSCKKFRIIECFIYLGGEILTHFAIKNYID